MYSVKETVTYELIIKNSKFICILNKISNPDDVGNILDNIKKEYQDANHYCYAYITNNTKKSSDDGEPSGTAGIPILKVLENNNLNNILCIVIRYFGGIKLGANGLIRAYSKSVANAIKESSLVELIQGYQIKLTFDYDKTKEIDYLLNEYTITNKVFDNKVSYIVNIPVNDIDLFKNIDYEIINKIVIEK